MNAPFHFYAANGFGWATAQNRHEAVRKLADMIGSDVLKEQRKANGLGMYVWTCKVVGLPFTAAYSIREFVPHEQPDGTPVLTEGGMSFYVVNTRGHVLPPN